MTQTKTNKTNKQWYEYKKLGAYFKLEKGVLLMCTELNDDGAPDKDDIGVIHPDDWYDLGDYDTTTREQMIQDLAGKE